MLNMKTRMLFNGYDRAEASPLLTLAAFVSANNFCGFSEFLDKTTKSTGSKSQDKWDYIKLKVFFTTK